MKQRRIIKRRVAKGLKFFIVEENKESCSPEIEVVEVFGIQDPCFPGILSLSYHIISYHIISFHIKHIISNMSYHIISYQAYHIMSIISYHVNHIMSYHINHIISYHIISYHSTSIIPYSIILSIAMISCHTVSII